MTQLLQIPPRNIPVTDANRIMTQVWYDFFNAMVSRAGGITGGLQPADDTLTSLAALNATPGLLVETGADTFTKRSLAAVAGQTVVTNPTGAGGNPTVGLAAIAGVAGVYPAPTSITVDGQGRITAIS